MTRLLMFQLVVWSGLFAGVAPSWMQPACGQAPNTKQIGNLTFTMAPGLTIEQATEPELVHWPVVADWDAEGRLVIVESAGVAKPIAEHNKQLLHRVVRLVDDNGDGRFDRRIVAADKLPFPEGVLCLGNTMLVAAPPAIWQLTDHDGDGICEERQIWHDGQTLTGCANDLHGPYLGRDGLIYWCKGAFAEQSRELSDGTIVKDSAAHVYRRRLKGGPVESVMSGGMDNPVELAITPEGERFFTSTFLQHPGNGLRDGIAHAIYGGVYGKDHGVINGLPRTGPLMPIMTQLGPAAPSGLLYLEQNRLLPADRSLLPKRLLVAALFNLQKVTAHRLLPSGSTYTTQDIDLVSADRIDFHPTDVLEDRDGSLLIVDTGGWYDLCCPTSRVDQQTASGGIYRLRPQKVLARAADRATPDWNSVAVEQLVEYIHDSRPWVSRMALLTLRERGGDEAVRLLTEQAKDGQAALEQRLAAAWGLSWLESAAGREALVALLDQPPPQLQHAACQAIAAHRIVAARESLERLLLETTEPTVRRAAAEALGRVGGETSIAPLMTALARHDPIDRMLSHSCQYALWEINQLEKLRSYLSSDNSLQRLTAMRIVEHRSPGTLEFNFLLSALQQTDAEERQFSRDVLRQRREAIPGLLQHVRERLSEAKGLAEEGTSQLDEWIELLSAWRDSDQLQQFVADQLNACLPLKGSAVGAVDTQRFEPAKRLTEIWRGTSLPGSLVTVVEKLVAAEPKRMIPWLARFDLSDEASVALVSQLHAMLDRNDDPLMRRQWLLSLPAEHTYRDDRLAEELAAAFVAEGSFAAKETAELLRRVKLTPAAAETLLLSFDRLAAPELMCAVELVSSVAEERLDWRLLERLVDLPSARALPQSFVRNVFRSRGSELQQRAREVEEQLFAPQADVAQAVAKMLESLPSGDPVEGLEIYRSGQTACAACHQMGYVGGQIGPELTRIGQSRTPEALLEAILYPSSRIEQSFQPWQLLTVDGQVLNGLLVREDEDQVELQLAADRRIAVQRSEIEEMRPSQVSIMPAGMSEILTPQQIADLLALLKAAR